MMNGYIWRFGEKVFEIKDRLFGSQLLHNVLNDVINSFEIIGASKTNSKKNVYKEDVKKKYREIFKRDVNKNPDIGTYKVWAYENIKSNKLPEYGVEDEIIADELVSPSADLKVFLEKHGCCWIDFVGCDNFSDTEDKIQIFFATISQTVDVMKQREPFLLAYKQLLERYPVDILVQLFFANTKSVTKHKDIISAIQKEGLIIPFTRKHYNEVSMLFSRMKSSRPILVDYDLLLDENDEFDVYETGDEFWSNVEKNVPNKDFLVEEINSFLSTIANKDKTEGSFSNLIKIVAKFNKSLYPEKVRLLYFIPIHCPDGSYGLFCYGANKVLYEKQLEDIKLLAYNILYPYVSAYKSAYEKEMIVKESIKSAVSAIMTRNMSHNLGSHYMYYTKADLEKIARNAFRFINWQDSYSFDDLLNNPDKVLIGPDIRGAAKVFSYIQARMDYLATVISNDKYPYGAVNFKSQIFDELTIDDFSRRHFRQNEGERTTNFLLANLIRSEDFSRPDVMTNEMPQKNHDIEFRKLSLQIKFSQDRKLFHLFTGTNCSKSDRDVKKRIKEGEIVRTMEDEREVKNLLSSLNIALPGGIMSCHALFNVIENFIRNSAKYARNNFDEQAGLVFTLAICPQENGQYLEIAIYDNKKNANAEVIGENGQPKVLYDLILEKLKSLKIVDDETYQISKDNKGFKEMLFSSVWMRSYKFGKDTYADIIAKINRADGKTKYDLIKEYGFSLIKVLDKPDKDGNSELIIYEDNKNVDSSSAECNLGLKIVLPRFSYVQELNLTRFKEKTDLTDLINAMLNMRADVVEVSQETIGIDQGTINLKHIFTRIYNSSRMKLSDEYEKFSRAIKERFPNIDEYEINFDSLGEANLSKCIYFRRHMDCHSKPSEYKGYAYADSVSGGNYTVTLMELFNRGKKEYEEGDKDFKILELKIKESALTKITIIDERLFNSSKDNRWLGLDENVPYGWLGLKNIRVLNQNMLDEKIYKIINIVAENEENLKERVNDSINDLICIIKSFSEIDSNIELVLKDLLYKFWNFIVDSANDKGTNWVKEDERRAWAYKNAEIIFKIVPIDFSIFLEGNEFQDKQEKCHFLSIHLGLIEKILKNSALVNYSIDQALSNDNNWMNSDPLDEKRVRQFMQLIRSHFGGEDLFITIHSGRGNYSKELDSSLQEYPFLSISALESAFNNSKYLLSQLFYNTVYLGKGYVNHQ